MQIEIRKYVHNLHETFSESEYENLNFGFISDSSKKTEISEKRCVVSMDVMKYKWNSKLIQVHRQM